MLKPINAYFAISLLALGMLSCLGRGPGITPEDQEIFASYFRFPPTADIRDFHYFPDEIGIDASYWISFECAESTFERIKDSLRLKQDKQPDEGLIGGLNLDPEPWWDTAYIRKERPYSRQNENIYWYLWYDKGKKRIYFLTFDT